MVNEDGEWQNDRYVGARNFLGAFAIQDSKRGQLSSKGLADLRALLRKLPTSNAKPPIERTVRVSFARDGRRLEEAYDSSSLPEPLEGVLKIIGERFETKDRHRAKAN